MDKIVSTRIKSLTDLCKEREAFETPLWAAEAILRHELLTTSVWDPCCGLGTLKRAAEQVGYHVAETDIEDWSRYFIQAPIPAMKADFLSIDPASLLGLNRFYTGNFTILMNPPFSLACEFIDRAFEIGARKIVCFQRWAWRESNERREWWAKRPPARIWLCGDRATCWRFDIADGERRGSTSTPHAWFVYERGHKGAEIVHSLHRRDE